MKTILLAVALSASAAPVLGADTTPDATFYKNAAEGGMAEVELGNLAQKNGKSQSVKDFGVMMVKDHSAANEKLKSVAAAKIVALPSSPSMGQMATKAKLEALSGDAFDKAYIKDMTKDHEEDIKEFNKEAVSGKDPDAKAYAASTLPTLEEHLRKIQSIAASSGVKVAASK